MDCTFTNYGFLQSNNDESLEIKFWIQSETACWKKNTKEVLCSDVEQFLSKLLP